MASPLVYALPSISAIAIKLVMLWYGRKAVRTADVWILLFLFGLFGVNVCELLSFFYSHNPENPNALRLLIAYYIFGLITSASYGSIALQLADRLVPLARTCIILLLSVGIMVVVIPNAAISGVQSIGYSATRIPGPFYVVLQVLLPAFWLIGSLALTVAATKNENWLNRRRALALLIGSLPLVLVVVGVVALMQVGVAINAVFVVSLATNLLLGVLIYTEYESGVFRFLSYIPSTRENRLVFHAARFAHDVSAHGLVNAVAGFERALISDALRRCKGNKTTAATLLGVSRTTLRRKI